MSNNILCKIFGHRNFYSSIQTENNFSTETSDVRNIVTITVAKCERCGHVTALIPAIMADTDFQKVDTSDLDKLWNR